MDDNSQEEFSGFEICGWQQWEVYLNLFNGNSYMNVMHMLWFIRLQDDSIVVKFC